MRRSTLPLHQTANCQCVSVMAPIPASLCCSSCCCSRSSVGGRSRLMGLHSTSGLVRLRRRLDRIRSSRSELNSDRRRQRPLSSQIAVPPSTSRPCRRRDDESPVHTSSRHRCRSLMTAVLPPNTHPSTHHYAPPCGRGGILHVRLSVPFGLHGMRRPTIPSAGGRLASPCETLISI